MSTSLHVPQSINPPAAAGGVEGFSAGTPGGVEGFLSALAQVTASAINPDVARVLRIPSKFEPHQEPGGAWHPALLDVDVTDALLRRPDPDAPRLFPVQSRMLIEAERARGLVAYVGVGRGKTPVVLLLPYVWRAQRPMLLTRAFLVEQLRRAADYWGQWYRVPHGMHFASHHLLSTRSGAKEFWAAAPDCLVIDEADHFCGKGSVRARLLVQYVQRHPNTRVAVLSGTMLRDSIIGPDHLSMLALRERSPLPTRPQSLEALSRAVDPPPEGELRAAPGMWQPLCDAMGEEDARPALGRRLQQTVGTVISQDEQPLPALNLRIVEPNRPGVEVTAGVDRLMDAARSTWCMPDGQQLKLAVELFGLLRQLSKGFYYRPVWSTPDGQQDLEWMEARAEWSRRLSRSLGNEPWNATKARLQERAEAGLWNPPEWVRWKGIRHKHGPKGPPRETVWLDDAVLRACADKVLQEGKPAVVWVLHRAVGQRLAELTGWRFYADGPRDAVDILDEDGTRTIIASVTAHGAGRDLQRWSTAHWLEVPGSNHVVEQLLGRHHRFGQRAQFVDVHLWALTWIERRALRRAEEKDAVPAQVTQERRKLLYATRVGPWPAREDPAGFSTEDLAELDELFDDL